MVMIKVGATIEDCLDDLVLLRSAERAFVLEVQINSIERIP